MPSITDNLQNKHCVLYRDPGDPDCKMNCGGTGMCIMCLAIFLEPAQNNFSNVTWMTPEMQKVAKARVTAKLQD